MARSPAKPNDETEIPQPARRARRGRPQVRSDEETRGLIFAAARHEFAIAGFATSSMEAVARRAGISTKTLYRLIPNKAALFEAMVTDRLDTFARSVKLRACEDTDIEAALRDALLACAELLFNPDVMAMQRMVLAESDKFPELAQTFYAKAMRRTVATLGQWVRTEKERGLVRVSDPELAAGLLLGMFAFEPQRAVLYGKKPLPSRKSIEERAGMCANLFLNGARAAQAL